MNVTAGSCPATTSRAYAAENPALRILQRTCFECLNKRFERRDRGLKVIEVAADWANVKSSETYLGSRRGSEAKSASQLRLNEWTLDGNWSVDHEAVVLNEPNGRIAFQFHARDLNLVMGPTSSGALVQFRVFIDGLQPGAAHGFDVDEHGTGTLSEQRAYQLIRQPAPISDRRFEIEFLDSGAAAYDFTFG
jgi:Thioredoxin like C-terminal domain